MMRPPLRFCYAALFFLFPWCTARAQQANPPDQGLNPFESFHGGDVDHVELDTGNLYLHIPLIGFPQRGALTLNFSLQSNNKGWVLQSGGGEYWTPATTPSVQPVDDDGWSWIIGSDGNQCAFFSILNAPDGSVIPLDFTSGAPAGPGRLHGCGTAAPMTLETTDGTALMYTGPNTPANRGVLIDRHGVRYTSSVTREDTNGNQITIPPTGGAQFLDSIGRTIPFPPRQFPPNNNLALDVNGNPVGGGLNPTTTNYTGCRGTQPIVYALLWNVPAPSGATATYKFCYAKIALLTNFKAPGVAEYSGVQLFLQSVVLPNGLAWTFDYSSRGASDPPNVNYGDLTKITFPAGGSISYAYVNLSVGAPDVGNFSRTVMSRTVDSKDGTGGHTWTYQWGTVSGTSPPTMTNSVTDPLGNQTVYVMNQYSTSDGGRWREVSRQVYQGSSSGGQLLKTVTTDWSTTSRTIVPIRETITWPNGKTKKTEKDYSVLIFNPPNRPQSTGSYGNVIATREFDYGISSPGPLVRTTTTSYLALSNSAYLNNNLVDLPSSVEVADGGATILSNATYGFDEWALASSGISTQHESAPPTGSFRGNQTSIHRQLLNGSGVSTIYCPVSVSAGGYLVSNITFFDTGTVNVSKDPCLHATTYAYSPTYAGAYPTSVTNAKNQVTTYAYDFNTGQKMSVTDPNNQATNYTYDVMWRLASVSYPDGGSDLYTHQETTFPFSVTLTKKITSSQNQARTAFFDGLGRVFVSQLADPQGTIYTSSTYDAVGRVATVSNPYRSTSDSTYGTTTNQYDALGRTTKVTKPDGSGSVVTTAYCGSTTLVTDEAGKWRRSTTDALGRLVEVDEPNSPTASVNSNGCPGTGEAIWVTSYAYDTLGNLASVTQGGLHGRSFNYDSMSWLRSSTNPETGTTPVTYTYDADGSVITKADARSITITYAYDVLHRLTGRSYSNGDPSVTYSFDQTQAGFYNIGRRTGMTDAGGSETLNYDQMGRELAHQRITNGITKSTSYTYYLDGSLATLTYPSGRIITYTTDSAGRPSVAKDTANNVNYVTGTCANGVANNGACYAPQRAPAQVLNGANLTSTFLYNSRLQPCWIYATTGTALNTNTLCTAADSTPGNALDLKYNFNFGAGDNGNVMGITNNRDTTRSETFTYDQVNRIATGGTISSCGSNCWGLTFGYDQWANLTTATATGSATPLNLAINANNRITTAGFTYDASGNLTADVTSAYAWNAESEIKTAGGVNYTYDGDGNRVQKSNGKIYWYGAGTQILSESDASGNITDEYTYFGGRRVARRNVSSGFIYYYIEDMLGSSRAIVDAGSTTPCYDADFYPYGGEKVFTNTCPQNYKFEGKERDAETGNDDFGARYYSSVYGRWLSPDWSSAPVPVPYANLSNPQTLNLYAMVHDNPETFADLDGHINTKYERGEESPDRGQTGNNAAQTPSKQGGVFEKLWNLIKYGEYKSTRQLSAEARDWLKHNLVQVADGKNVPLSSKQMNEIDKLSDSDVIGAYQGALDAQKNGQGVPPPLGGTPLGSGIADQIANGHAYEKHGGEFPGMSKGDFKKLIQETIDNPSASKQLSGGRTAYWNDAQRTVVVTDPASPDGGTAFRPTNGRAYFDGLK